MVIGLKDAAKCIGISIIACCAVLVCTMFLNFYLDIRQIEDAVAAAAKALYTAQVSTAKVVCLVSGGCLLATAVVMLLFYIKHYIDDHHQELGILKALGYSNRAVAKHFWVFGMSVLLGAAAGFAGAFLLMPKFYALQNADQLLPELAVHFHPAVLLSFVILPAVFFSALAIFYAGRQLKRPVTALLRGEGKEAVGAGRKEKEKDRPFLDGLRKSTLSAKKTLVFFMIFAAFCFSAMTQMSASMRDLASPMMGAMILLIGIVLACTTLFLAISTVIAGNRKTIAMMRVFGYSQKVCCRALLGGYRPMAYIGFALGTAYQYALLRIMVDVVFGDIDAVPVYQFDVPVMLVSLAAFLIIYEITMYHCCQKIKRISIKEIMLT